MGGRNGGGGMRTLDGEELLLLADGIFVKQMLIPKKGEAVPQHSHKYGHHTFVARGSVAVFLHNREHIGNYKEMQAVYIRPDAQHLIMALEDDTLCYCIHNVSREGKVEILAENKIGMAA